MPVVNKQYEFLPDYKIVGIDEHLQASFGSSFYNSEDDKVTGWGVLDESLSGPLYKLAIDCSSLEGEFYFDDPFLP